MYYAIDPKTGEFLWYCPQCKEYIRFPTLMAIRLAEQAGGCQGCRARATLKRNPGLISIFLYFWSRTNGWPQSSSWMEAIPVTA